MLLQNLQVVVFQMDYLIIHLKINKITLIQLEAVVKIEMPRLHNMEHHKIWPTVWISAVSQVESVIEQAKYWQLAEISPAVNAHYSHG